MTENSSENVSTKNNKKKKVIVIVLIIIIALLISTVTYAATKGFTSIFLFQNVFSTASDSTSDSDLANIKTLTDSGQGNQGTAPEKSQEEILAELEKQQIIVTDSISPNIIFATGSAGTEGTWKVENLAENTVIQQVEVFYKDQLIAKTTPIYPDQYIDSITLTKALPSGELEGVAYINYYNLDTKEIVGKTGYDLIISVQ